MPLERDAVRRAAQLARVTLSPAELDRLMQDLDSRIARLESLRAVEPRPVEPEREDAAPRADVPGPDRLHEPLARLAPAWRDGWLTVPRVIPAPE